MDLESELRKYLEMIRRNEIENNIENFEKFLAEIKERYSHGL